MFQERQRKLLRTGERKLERIRRGHLEDVISYIYAQKQDFDFLIKFRDLSYKKVKKTYKILSKVGEVIREFKYIPFFAVRLGGKEAKEIYDMLTGQASRKTLKKYSPLDFVVEKIEAPFQFSKQDYVAGELSPKILESPKGKRWNLEDIGAYSAQEVTNGRYVKVAILDTGIDYNHSELSSRFGHLKGENFVSSGPPLDDEGHGTHVAGICAGETTGVAPGATLYAVKVLDDSGQGTDYEIIEGLEWAVDHGIDIVNMSLGSPAATSALEEMCNAAYERGVILVAAAGNEGYGASYPASFDSVISVAAVDENNNHAHFSNIYDTVEISAPGVNIVSTYPGGEYCSMSGTSMAAPHVSGALALYLGFANTKDKKEVRERLKKTARPLIQGSEFPDEWLFGAGLVQADELVKSLLSNIPGSVYSLTKDINEKGEERKLRQLQAHFDKWYKKMKSALEE